MINIWIYFWILNSITLISVSVKLWDWLSWMFCSCSWIVPSYWQNSWEWVFFPHSNWNQISPLWQQGYWSLGLSYFGRTTPLWNRIGGMEAGLDQDSINSQLFLLRFSSFSWINVSQFIICLFSISGILK